jgi:hypothetical protein
MKEGGSTPTRCPTSMTWFFIMMPLMVLAVAIATVPVLYHSVREHNLIHYGAPTKPRQRRPGYAARRVDVTERHRVDA